MARVRGILNDNSVASIYANTSVSKNVSSNSVLASTTSATKRLSVEVSKPGLRVTTGSGYLSPFTMFTSGTMTKTTFSYRSAVATSNAASSSASNTTIRLNHLAYGSTNTNTSTLLIPGGTLSSSNTLNIAFSTGDRFWVDVVSLARPSPGLGLLVTFDYYEK